MYTYVTSISFSYFMLGAALISICFFIYFRALVTKTSPDNASREKIIGNMKDPVSWRKKNNTMSYVSVFWGVLSLILFVYFKYFYTAGLINIYFVFGYLAFICITLFLFRVSDKKVA